ncbi:lipoprotein [Rhodopirellula sallentina SM41]|uniref:Lipoprotein n=2 Tax=Rhodopirellula TaxID=265488 RepID=M5UAH2_9BACT|nr:lipoprotein [Rhodopirellula sallentina SM41]
MNHVSTIWAILLFAAMSTTVNAQSSDSATSAPRFSEDVSFLKQHTDVVLLRSNDAAIAVAPAYQGRVMTSTYDLSEGPSFGWINRPVIERGLMSDEEKAGKLEEHIYIFGGEERFWLGPEGGQYAIFFKPGTKFEFEDWTTPPAIDTEPFRLVEQNTESALFEHETQLVNFSGTRFHVGIQRRVTMLDREGINALISDGSDQSRLASSVRFVGYETDNRITNLGDQPWTPEKGLLSIWMLGMYNPSPDTTVVIPFKSGDDAELGPKVNDTYFGKVPADYLRVDDDVLFFKGDGTRRGKIGVSPQRSKGIAGSYDSKAGVLTLLTYNVQESPNGFVNSMWEHQEEPYSGDVLNSYNDGSPAPGEAPLGPFYELESSSPAAALKTGETMQHVQKTWHIQGSEADLDPISQKLLGASLAEIENAFASPSP